VANPASSVQLAISLPRSILPIPRHPLPDWGRGDPGGGLRPPRRVLAVSTTGSGLWGRVAQEFLEGWANLVGSDSVALLGEVADSLGSCSGGSRPLQWSGTVQGEEAWRRRKNR